MSGGTPIATLAPFSRTFRQDLPALTDLFDLFSTFGVLWLLGLRRLPGPTSFQRRALVYGALVVLQLTVSRGDEGRNLSHLFPVLVPLAMLEVERALAIGGRAGTILATTLVVACTMSLVHARWTFVEPALLRYGLVAVGTVTALIVAWGMPFIVERRSPSSPGRPATDP